MQDYKMVVRPVWAGATLVASDGAILAQNFAEAIDYLNEMYLQNGYKLVGQDFLGDALVNEVDPNAPRALRYAWHFVKELNDK